MFIQLYLDLFFLDFSDAIKLIFLQRIIYNLIDIKAFNYDMRVYYFIDYFRETVANKDFKLMS